MAEPFGIAAGAIGITAAFTACVDCFDYVQHSRHFGRDYQTELISLDCARLRLTRWGEAVNIHEDPNLGRPNARASEVQVVQGALLQILVLFADTEKISNKYRLERTAGDNLALLAPNDLEPTVLGLRNKVKELAVGRQKRASILKTTSWALYHRSQLKDLVSGITSLLDSIEKIFPAPEKMSTLVKQEAAAMSNPQELEVIRSAAPGVDDLLLAAVKEVLTGHQYLKVTIKGKAHTGDSYSNDWRGKGQGASHVYEHVFVDEKGKAQVGNRYGEKDFWDD
ncbi:hypothetical protein yc1106_03876 [Curvularia clavata]|uniref:Prion-inhibition and propagation HeLo domain-containing protein n=1 Tax=Curvularia clavata TaxID=95742 RepID=A0A9Q8Z5B0_CURCL|nr:hypothetical protein yc1106_03876 [Curvularia clavata]